MIAYDDDPDAVGAIQYGYGLDGSSCTYFVGQRPDGVTDQRYQVPRPGGSSPWGKLQGVDRFIVPHIGGGSADNVAVSCSTARHGGIWLAPHIAHSMPQWCQRFASAWSHGWGPQWYEEDTAAGLVLMSDPCLAAQSPDFFDRYPEFVELFQRLPGIQRLDAGQRATIAAQFDEWSRQLEIAREAGPDDDRYGVGR
jgi:hypothetical protein